MRHCSVQLATTAVAADVVIEDAGLLGQVTDLTGKLEVLAFRLTQLIMRLFGRSGEHHHAERVR